MNKKTKHIIHLYKKGLSTYKIAKILNSKQDTIKHLLIYHKIIRPALGRKVEQEVFDKLYSKSKKTVHQKGDATFDILYKNMRIDVKSSSLNDNKFKFFLQKKKDRKNLKIYQENVDKLLLVFLTLPDRPMYFLDTDELTAIYTLSIPSSFNTKYNLKFFDYLGGDNNG